MLSPASALAGETFARVRANGEVRCGISEQLAGFSFKDVSGRWQGLNVDFCRAVAAAALGDAEKVVLVPVSASARFPRLLSGEVNLLVHTATRTLGREAGIGVLFAGALFYDTQAFMVPRSSKARRIADLNGVTICVETKTTHEINLASTFSAQSLKYTPLAMDSLASVTSAFFADRCQAFTSDRSQLMAIQSTAPGGPEGYTILPDAISRETGGPVVRRGDDEWFTLVQWVLFALIEAEERGVTRANVRALHSTATDPVLRQFLGASGHLGKMLGVNADWVVQVVAAVGNYGEIYERNFGKQSALPIERGLNQLWTHGGLLDAPLFQ